MRESSTESSSRSSERPCYHPAREVKLDARWTTYDKYFRVLESKGIALNVVHNVGAEQVRRTVLGDEDAAPTAAQLEEMLPAKALRHRR